jgi:hypothetical protein
MSNLTTHFKCEDDARCDVTNYLTGIVTHSTHVKLGENTSRKYHNQNVVSSIVGGNRQSSVIASVYEVRARSFEKGSKNVLDYDENTVRLRLATEHAAFTAEEFASSAKKNHRFGGDFRFFDYCMIIERLAGCIAYFTIHQELPSKVLRGGVPINVKALVSLTPDVIASTNTLFVTRMADTQIQPNRFYALAAAASACGTTVVTDMVTTDEQFFVVLNRVENIDLVIACIDVLAMLAGQYEKADMMSTFMYALTRGLHRVATVIAHSNEGGLFRDVMRVNGFSTPYGGVDTSLKSINLPRPVQANVACITQWVDTLLLVTGGIVAACDPLIEKGNRLYPTVLTAISSPLNTYGGAKRHHSVEERNVEQWAKEHAVKIRDYSGDFCSLYDKALGTICGGSSVGEGVIKHMVACFGNLEQTSMHHLKYESIAPFYFIEPTGLCKLPATFSSAVREGYAQLATFTSRGYVQYIPSINSMYTSSTFSTCTSSYRTARTAGFILAHQLAKNDGLANVNIAGADPALFALSGNATCSDDIRQRMESKLTFDAYLWGRGHSAFPHPAELMYFGGGIKLKLRHSTIDEENWEHESTVLPSCDELGQSVEIETGRLEPVMKPNKVLVWGKAVSRSRTAALTSLARTKHKNKHGIDAYSDVVVMSDFGITVTEEMVKNVTIKWSGQGLPGRVINQADSNASRDRRTLEPSISSSADDAISQDRSIEKGVRIPITIQPQPRGHASHAQVVTRVLPTIETHPDAVDEETKASDSV